jgi:ubiquinone/menaquinone biosynthesis C-methylase UbiE
MAGARDLDQFDARRTYGTAAADYDDASREYWRFLSERTVDRVRLRPGQRVLDVACGTGWSAVAAAHVVGTAGSVVAVDYAEPMLDITRQKVSELGLRNVEVMQADATQLNFDEASFDAVVCVLGIFFLEDMAAAAAGFWRLLRPDGVLAITVLGEHFFAPLLDEAWRPSMLLERPDLQILLPWERTRDPETLRAVLVDAGIPDPTVEQEHQPLALSEPEDWWRIVKGSGLRRYVDEIGPQAAQRVRDDNLRFIEERRIDKVTLSAIYATARAPSL